MYRAFTSSQDDPGVKEDMGSEPGGKKYKLQQHYKQLTQRNLRVETNSPQQAFPALTA